MSIEKSASELKIAQQNIENRPPHSTNAPIKLISGIPEKLDYLKQNATDDEIKALKQQATALKYAISPQEGLLQDGSLNIKAVCQNIRANLDANPISSTSPTVINKYDHLFIDQLKNVIKTKKQLIKKRDEIVASLLDPEEKGAYVFAEMMRRIPAKQFQPIQAALEAPLHPDFLKNVDSGDLTKVATVENYPIEALKALRAGLISKEVFTTIQMYRTTVEYVEDRKVDGGKVEMIPLFIEGKINPRARELIQETMVLRKELHYTPTLFPSENPRLLNANQIDLFFKKLKSKHPIEQQFFLYPHLDPSILTITRAITESTSLNALFRSKDFRMVPSFSMMQDYLAIKYKEAAIQINPVIAVSAISDIASNGLTGRRDMGISIPGVTLPYTADGYRAAGPEFFLHDFYHAMSVSSAPQEHRAFFIRVASILKKAMSTFSEEEIKIVRALVDRLIDLELNEHLLQLLFTGSSATSQSVLWSAFLSFIQDSFPNNNSLSNSTKQKIFSAIRDGLREEDVLLMGLPNQLYEEEKLRTEQKVKMAIPQHMDPERIMLQYKKELDAFIVSEIPSLPASEANFAVTTFIRNFWDKTMSGNFVLGRMISIILIENRRTLLSSLVESRLWERPGDDALFAQKDTNPDSIKVPLTALTDLQTLIKKLPNSPRTSRADYLQFIKSHKDIFDSTIASCCSSLDKYEGQETLAVFYVTLEKSLAEQTKISKWDPPNEKKLTEQNLIKEITQNIFMSIFHDKKFVQTIAEFLLAYRSVLYELDTIQFEM